MLTRSFSKVSRVFWRSRGQLVRLVFIEVNNIKMTNITNKIIVYYLKNKQSSKPFIRIIQNNCSTKIITRGVNQPQSHTLLVKTLLGAKKWLNLKPYFRINQPKIPQERYEKVIFLQSMTLFTRIDTLPFFYLLNHIWLY